MKISKFITACAIALASFAATAQNGVITPYSRYGYGMLNDNATSAQKSMGGVGYAMQSGRQTNVMNPGSYAAIDSLTFLFDMGIDVTCLWQNETVDGKRIKDSNTGGGLSYVTMQFPVGRYMGASIGILPYSSVGYAFGNSIDNGASSRQGTGSINQLYAGIAGRPFKGFSIGANIAYLFGTTFNDSYVTSVTGSTTLFERQFEVRDWRLDIGAQYGIKIGRDDRLTLGLTYSPAKDFHGHSYVYSYDMSDMSNDNKPAEEDKRRLQGNFSMAESWGAGINYQWGNNIMAEADFTYQPWSKAKYDGLIQDGSDSQLADRYKIAAGFQIQPKPRGNYFERIRYRIGGFYNRDYLKINGNNLRDWGLTAGFGFPVPQFKTIVSLGLEWINRSATPNPLIKENYLNITIGINFNEMWFRQSKIY